LLANLTDSTSILFIRQDWASSHATAWFFHRFLCDAAFKRQLLPSLASLKNMPYKNKEDKRANSRQKYASLSKEEKSGEGKVESLCGKETKTGIS
jgi:hypothetical protein